MLDLISRGTNLSMLEANAITPLLSLLSSLLSNALFSVHDNEFYGEEGKQTTTRTNNQVLLLSGKLLTAYLEITYEMCASDFPELNWKVS